MKKCPRQKAEHTTRSTIQRIPIHRYSHPIQTGCRQGSSTEELLAEVLAALSRQTALLEQLLCQNGETAPLPKDG